MFDYQAGEKHKLTLIMVGLSGLMAGIFFTMLLMPTPEPTRHSRSAYANRNSDLTGRPDLRQGPDIQGRQSSGAGAVEAMTPPVSSTDPNLAKSLIEQWLPLAWDLSAGSAHNSQEKAMAYMTPECATAYKQNIWTPDLAQQIDQAGLRSTFHTNNVSASEMQADGSVVVSVNGQQTLGVPGKGGNSRVVSLEYLVRQTTDGLRIAGISEGGQGGL